MGNGKKWWKRSTGLLVAVFLTMGVAWPVSGAALATEQVEVNFRIEPVRVVVIDQEGRVIAIYSNTPAEPYRLLVRQGRVNGTPIPLTREIASAYRELAGHINWEKNGLVWSLAAKP